MQNHGLGICTVTKFEQIIVLPEIPHNIFGRSAQSPKIFWDIFEKKLSLGVRSPYVSPSEAQKDLKVGVVNGPAHWPEMNSTVLLS